MSDDECDMSGPLDSLEEGSHHKNLSAADSIAISPELIEVGVMLDVPRERFAIQEPFCDVAGPLRADLN